MRFALLCTVFSLPLIGEPRLGNAVKLSDFTFIFLIFCEILSYRFRLTLHLLLLIAFFTIFAFFGYYYINYVATPVVMGGWDVGLLSMKGYQFVDEFRILILAIGSAILAKYLFHPKSQILRFQFWYFIVWSIIAILGYLKGCRSLGDIWAEGHFMRGTFTEQGPMSFYVVFIYALYLTLQDVPGAPKFKRSHMALLVVVVLADLLLCRGDRGTILFLAFSVAYIFTRRAKVVLRILPVLLIVGVLLMPLFGRGIKKFEILQASTAKQNIGSDVGRYAAVIVAPRLIASTPVFGLGLGNYIFYRTSEQYAADMKIVPKDEPDSCLLEILVECGAVGLTIYLVLVVVWPGYLVFKTRSWSLWPFYVAYVVDLNSGTLSYFEEWVWLFAVIAVAKAYRVGKARMELDIKPMRAQSPDHLPIPAFENAST